MLYELNKKLLLSNITFLLEETGKKIGELEKEAGVSTGYISRLAKEENSRPGIDFIIGVAEALNVNIDSLLKSNLSELPPTGLYIFKFLNKLETDTLEDKLYWEKESKTILQQYRADGYGNVEHPLLSFEVYNAPCDEGYEERQDVIFISNSYETNTDINGDWFKLRLKNSYYLYLTNISQALYDLNDNDVVAKEIWMVAPQIGKKYICGTKDNKTMAETIENLYAVVTDRMKIPKLEPGLRATIDAFMKDDLVDDPPPQVLFDEEIPF